MAIIKLENIAATASITIQLIKDYSMYTSEIISSNGTIFQSTDTSTTLTLKIYKGIEDITNKITDIEWSRFYFNNDELVEDRNWGKDKKNKQKIILYKDEIEEKSIIQASGFSSIEGSRELVTTARITIIKISDIYISDIMPVNPSDKMMWMDTNKTPPTLKIWSDELGYWMSSGIDVPIVKNLIKNSNFWAPVDDYYTIENSNQIQTPVRISYQNKQWLKLESKNTNGQSGGVYQEIQYPIQPNSNYIFSLIGYREGYLSQSVLIKIVSLNENGIATTIIEDDYSLGTNITSVSVPFTTLNDTKKLEIHLLTTDARVVRKVYVTELSLYNSSVYYPWELCPDDVDKQMNTKLDNSRTSVFNTLTDNGRFQAIYESENQYYIRAAYITPAIVEKAVFDALQTKVTELETQLNNLKTQYTNDIKSLTERIAALEKPTEPPQN